MASRRIVVVDDSRELRSMVRAFLRKHPTIEVVGDTDDPNRVVELVRSKRADVVLLDLNLGGRKGGREVLAQIRKEVARVTVIILSAYSDWEIRRELIDAGANGFIAKADISRLGHELDAVLRQ